MKIDKRHIALLTIGALLLLRSRTSKNAIRHGIVLKEYGPEISDWSSWMNWGPRAMREAMDDGAANGQQILSHCMRRLFPEKQWPPEADSPYAEKWRELARGMDRAISTTEPEDDEYENVIPFRR